MQILLWSLLLLVNGVFGQAQVRFMKTVPTLTELIALNPNDIHTNVMVNSYWIGNTNSIGSIFQYAPASADATNTYSVFKPTSYGGRWIRVETPANPGSASQPGVRFWDNQRSGMFSGSGTNIIAFSTDGTQRWQIGTGGILQSTGPQTITTSTGALTLSTSAGNGNITLSPHGTGKVGIGTASPGDMLDVYGTSVSGGNVSIRSQNLTTDGYSGYDIYNESGTRVFTLAHSGSTAAVNASTTWIGTRNSEPLHFVINGTSPKMTLTAASNLLIGTTSETGLTGAGGLKIASATASGTGAGALVVAGGAAFGGGLTLTGANTITTSTGNLTLATGGASGHIILSPATGGNVGIGTTTPSSVLHVEQTTTSGLGLRVQRNLASASTDNAVAYITNNNVSDDQATLLIEQVGSGDILRLIPNAGYTGVSVNRYGNVGIGTTLPLSKLEVRGVYAALNGGLNTSIFNIVSSNLSAVDTGATMQFNGESGNGSTPYGFAAIKGAKESAVADNYSGYLSLWTVPTGSGMIERVRVSGAGNLLIGTTSETGLTGAGGLKIASATDSLTTSSGSIITAGGLGVAKAAFVGGLLNVTGLLTNVGGSGQATLTAGTIAITVTGVTTASLAFVQLVTPNTVSSTVNYQAVCTANTITIRANVAAGTINTADISTLNYFVVAK